MWSLSIISFHCNFVYSILLHCNGRFLGFICTNLIGVSGSRRPQNECWGPGWDPFGNNKEQTWFHQQHVRLFTDSEISNEENQFCQMMMIK
jgi:hypothetical protein